FSIYQYPHPLTYLPFFSFHCPGAHRLLHSFPTRRSSDLTAPASARRAPGRTRKRRIPSRTFPRRRETSPDGQDSSRALRAGSRRDRKSTPLNSSHVSISYAVFCLKKKKKKKKKQTTLRNH